jgi:ubiquitin carboxyl-terminal hydrolase 17
MLRPSCSWQTANTKTRSFVELPDTLIIQLSRFDNQLKKVHVPVEFHDVLDTRPLCPRVGRVYTLWGVLHHVGASMHSGHYTATVKESDGCVLEYNDSKVSGCWFLDLDLLHKCPIISACVSRDSPSNLIRIMILAL